MISVVSHRWRDRGPLPWVMVVSLIAGAPSALTTASAAQDAVAEKDGSSVQVLGPFVSKAVSTGFFKGDIRDLPRVDEALLTEMEGKGRFVGAGFKPLPDSSVTFRDPVWQDGFRGAAESVASLAAPILNFDGQVTGPPHDPIGDVGPNHYVQAVNRAFAVYDKTGALLAGPTALSALFAQFGGPCGSAVTGQGDPIVLYDPLADRWLIGQIATPSHACIAVSQGPSPLGSYFLTAFDLGGFPDYWKLAVWPDAYYVTANLGGYALVGAFERARMINPGALNPGQATFHVSGLPGLGFNIILPADLDGSSPPPNGSKGVFYRQVDGQVFGGADRIELFEFAADWLGNAFAFTGPTPVPTSAFDMSLCGFLSFACVPQPPPGKRLDPLNEMGMWRFVYRNFGNHETLLGSFGVDANGSNLHGIRWFELRRNATHPWSLFQEGTYAPQPGASAEHRWAGSIAMDGSGNIALGYAVSGPSVFPSLRYTGRLVTDPPGTMPQGEQVLIAGASADAFYSRFGDYFSLNVDPTDDCTFWLTGEYMGTQAAGGRRTRIGTFKVGSCSSMCGNGVVTAPAETCDPPGSATCNCCSTHNSPGCSNSSCTARVCAINPSCCSGNWTAACVSLALADPVCAACCSAACQSDCTYCGDGTVNDVEACDDGNYVSGDGCSPACRVVCGDGFKVGPETCDPPGTVACNCCSVHPGSGCSSSACSNSVCNSDPACCSGSWSAHCASLAQNDPACGCCGTTCTTDCNYCGDGVTNLGEQCDDGNAAAGDGCSANCMLSCGNGLVDPGESCDPPGTIDNCCTYHAGGACSDPACQAAVCAIDPFCCGGPPFDWDYTCVNHALRSLACAAACNGCRTDCTSCGDGTVNRGEQCDPPGSFLGSDCCGTHPGPGCGDALCAAAVCAARPSCCALQWDASCGAAAAIEPRCGACAPLGQCNPICCVDSDSDGSCDISDACPMASNPFGVEALFDRTIYAIDKTRFGWTNVSSIDWLVGDLGQLASYSVIAVATPPVTKEFSSPLVPPSGHGYYYVVRPSCWLGSWSTQALKECTSPPGCLAGGRDANFPPPPVAP